MDAQVKAGKKGTPWTGVRAHGAKLHLMEMAKPGDEGVLSTIRATDKAVVGVVEVVKTGLSGPNGRKGCTVGRRRYPWRASR